MAIDFRALKKLRRQQAQARLRRRAFHGNLHEGAANPRAGAILEIVELADDVARRAARYPGCGPKSSQVGAVIGSARQGLVLAPR
jgi:hypothetical protein